MLTLDYSYVLPSVPFPLNIPMLSRSCIDLSRFFTSTEVKLIERFQRSVMSTVKTGATLLPSTFGRSLQSPSFSYSAKRRDTLKG
jgi:hypothetical protein